MNWKEHVEFCLERGVEISDIISLPNPPVSYGRQGIPISWPMRGGENVLKFITFSDVARVVLPRLSELVTELVIKENIDTARDALIDE